MHPFVNALKDIMMITHQKFAHHVKFNVKHVKQLHITVEFVTKDMLDLQSVTGSQLHNLLKLEMSQLDQLELLLVTINVSLVKN